MHSTFNWQAFPAEMRRSVLDHLALKDLWACAQVDRDMYSSCLPILFQSVKLSSYQDLNAFVQAVPSYRHKLIHHLDISLPRHSDYLHLSRHHDTSSPTTHGSPTELLATLLSNCHSLESLSIAICGTLSPAPLLSAFKSLDSVKRFKLENLGQDDAEPISERLAVSLAFALPRLEDLTLIRITRSAKHAHELYLTNVPITQGDNNIPSHPLLGENLCLPQLLRLPNLRRLKIRDTHLGDPQWAGPPLDDQDYDFGCPLEVIDLGSCPHVCPAANEAFTARILSRVPPSITSCALSTSLPPPESIVSPLPASPCSSGQASPSPSTPTFGMPPMPRLRTLHLTPLVPTSAINTTLSQPLFASSPVHTLSCSFHPDDAADGCAALEAFLRERARGCSSAMSPLSPPMHATVPTVKPIIPGRKRASSKLSLCTQFEEDEQMKVDVISPILTEEPAAISPGSYASPSSSGIYPSLCTLAVEIPEEAMSANLNSPGGMKLSPRRLAAAKRRAEERLAATKRLQDLAKEIGLEVIVNGVSVKAEVVKASGAAPALATGTIGTVKNAARARANTTF